MLANMQHLHLMYWQGRNYLPNEKIAEEIPCIFFLFSFPSVGIEHGHG